MPSYDISIVTSDNPEFGVSCEAIGTSEKGELPVVNETQCGTYTVAVAKSDDGGLILTVRSDQKRRVGTYTIPSDDITTATSGGQSYTGDSSFTIDVKNAFSGSASGSASVSGTSAAATSTPTVSSASSASPSASSISSTTTLEPSTTGTTTSSSSSPSESTNGAARGSAFASVLFAAGLMALVF
ncbi:hypothetical protein SAMD00023353_2300120 [Rosellinia necatrix]|uniref:Uncharacterized protein n=1 Tax=Rosellinia necatrix TaxID=77044 RepID=A0A1W2TGL0_ROSNE|nr:hypothetical protein SAMD00023353_2300120 [Rosellinia necatrix]